MEKIVFIFNSVLKDLFFFTISIQRLILCAYQSFGEFIELFRPFDLYN